MTSRRRDRALGRKNDAPTLELGRPYGAAAVVAAAAALCARRDRPRARRARAGAYARLLIDALKVAKNRGAFLLSEAPERRTFSAGARTVLRCEPSRRECVALARLARQPVPHAVSLARSSRKQRGQSCISRDARRAPRRRTVAGSGAQRVHRSHVTGRTAPVWAAALGTAELDSCPARAVCG